jgi:hypothetical protein
MAYSEAQHAVARRRFAVLVAHPGCSAARFAAKTADELNPDSASMRLREWFLLEFVTRRVVSGGGKPYFVYTACVKDLPSRETMTVLRVAKLNPDRPKKSVVDEGFGLSRKEACNLPVAPWLRGLV